MSFKDKLSRYTPNPIEIAPGDFYVAVHGSDEGDGSFEHPFATVERAVEAVRSVKGERNGVTVCIRAGEYRTPGILLTEADSGSEHCPITYRAYGDGEVILNGGVTINSADFEPIPDEIRDRLHGEARERVVQVDLTRYGLTKEDWGELHPIGKFGTEEKYDDYIPGTNCELFFNGDRMTLARYPDGEMMQLDAVNYVGDVWEFPEQNYYYSWNNRRNHDGGTYLVDRYTTARMQTWKSFENIWAYGYFYHDWADSSTPIKAFDLEQRSFFPKYVSRYGARKGGLFYFYNVLDELDTPGEWYLNRETGMLYFYPPADLNGARIEMTITERSIIDLRGANHITFDGLTVKGTRADAVYFEANDCTFRRMNVSGVLGAGFIGEGYRNLVAECEISHTGKGGITLTGGDRNTLTPGCNRADNNHIHHIGEVFMVYCGGVQLNGCGNICSHNEIHDGPHTAVFYYGNDHIIEYNHIYDMVLHSSDAGAIYSGQDWAGQGCVIRYNVLYGIGGTSFHPDGIYFDDMLSGQTAYGNLLIGVRKNGFLIGGGRDNHVYNNIVVNAGWGITYDNRGRDGFLNNGWASKSVIDENGSMWQRLRQSPYQSEIWAAKYPTLARLSSDFSDPQNPDFGPNPSYGHVHDNLIIDGERSVGRFFKGVPTYSCIENNFAYASEEEAGMENGEYVLYEGSPAKRDMPAFENIPLEKIGRY